jgi:tetratricopeptide (TPR) repeat protein
LGQFDAAAQAYQRAIALYLELSAAPASPQHKLELARIENELGRLLTSRQQVAAARQAHLAALALLETAAAQPAAPAAVRFELARTCYFLGTQERPLPANPRQADRPAPIAGGQRDHLTRAVTLLNALTVAPPVNPDYQHLLALCYLEGAAVADARRAQAKGGAEHAIEILEGLVAALPEIPDYAYDLSEAYARIHIPRPPIPFDTERQIEERFGKSLALLEKLVLQHPDVPDFRAAKARLHDKLGAFQRQRERWTEAEQSFRQAIALQMSLVQQFPAAAYYGIWLATFRIALADALLQRNQPGAARTELEGTLATLVGQLEQRPELHPPARPAGDGLCQAGNRLAAAWRARWRTKRRARPSRNATPIAAPRDELTAGGRARCASSAHFGRGPAPPSEGTRPTGFSAYCSINSIFCLVS